MTAYQKNCCSFFQYVKKQNTSTIKDKETIGSLSFIDVIFNRHRTIKR
ncbi:MAG: hypothetical protein JJT76_03890 [Clostridiaceae bacterium]|nr:hypothetical protein [Clostridiaceae bacterium]